MLERGELTKLKIYAYSDVKFTDKVGDGEFTTLINPEKYALNYKIELNDKTPEGGSSTELKYTKTLPEDLELDFVFDRTGALRSSEASKDGIIDDITKFKEIVFNYNGENHKPNYLKVFWGTLLFKGSLTEMNLEYKLFNSDGTPIRAMARVKIKGTVENDLKKARENKSSPDLTHLRTVKEGDTLPLMCHRIYGDSGYYLEVAKVNQLYNFRTLEVGRQIFFPPLAKTS